MRSTRSVIIMLGMDINCKEDVPNHIEHASKQNLILWIIGKPENNDENHGARNKAWSLKILVTIDRERE